MIIFEDLPSICVYIDDMLIAAETFHEHMQVIEESFSRIREQVVLVKMLLTMLVYTVPMKDFNMKILTKTMSFSLMFLNMLRPRGVFWEWVEIQIKFG